MVMLKLEEQPPLIKAIFSGELEDVKNLLDGQPDVNYQDAEKRSPLHAAAYKGDKDLAELLLLKGARVNTRDSRFLTPLHRACGVGAEKTVALLLKHEADTTARDRQWQTPLHIAAANNAFDCVSILLKYVSNVNVTDRAGRTALHHAALNGHSDVVELLIAKGCIVNACDKKDCRPLHWAAHLGHVGTMELLIRNGADVQVRDRNQYTPLHVAAASGMVYACRLLLNAGAEVDAQHSMGNTPLHIACLHGHLPVCQELHASQANLEAVNYRGQTPLHIAAASTDGLACMGFLLDRQVNINRQSSDGRTPLHMSAIHGRFTRSKTLIDKGAIVDSQDKNGNTALHIAAQNGHDILTATLLGYGADPNKRGYEGRTPLHSCSLSGHVEVSRKFIQANVDLNTKDDTGKTPIHCAAYKGSVECLDLLVSQGANFKLQDGIGRTALHYAAAGGHYNCVFTLVGIGAPVNVVDTEGCTPLHLASSFDEEGRCVEYLLQHRADAKLQDIRGFTAVHYAVNGRNLHALQYLLSSLGKNHTLHGPETPSNTPLHLAARSGNLNILRAIVPYFPNMNIKNESGYTPLLIAAREGHTECVQMLLRYGAKVGISEDVYCMSPVHYSAKNGHAHCLALLVDNTEDKTIIDKPDKFNRTALMLAVSGSHSDCVLTLLKVNSDPNIVDFDKHSSLFRAVVTDQNNVVQLLISNGASLTQPDVNGKTVVHLAAACGSLPCLQTILNHVEPEEAAKLDHQEFGPLHWACYHGNANCVDYLLQKGVYNSSTGNAFSPAHCATFAGSERCLELLHNHGENIVDHRDARRRTPLHIAALHGHTECARYLLEQGAEIDAKDENGRTPLIAASQFGQTQMIELLVAYKADIKAKDENGNTALHLACLRKHSHTALVLMECTTNAEVINMTNNDRKTPLHLSARNGLVDVTGSLIKRGSSVLAVDSNGLTPALSCAPNPCVAQCLAIILANHPTSNHSSNDIPVLLPTVKMIPKKSAVCQTELSLSRNPDELLDDLFTKVKKGEKKSEIKMLLPAKKKSGKVVLIENYEQDCAEIDCPKAPKGQGDLLAAEEAKLLDGYKKVAARMQELSKLYNVSYDDITKVYMNHCSNNKSSLLNNRHVENYEDVFKQVLGDKKTTKKVKVPDEECEEKACCGDGAGPSGLGPPPRKKRCNCQYVCADCVMDNMFDPPKEEPVQFLGFEEQEVQSGELDKLGVFDLTVSRDVEEEKVFSVETFIDGQSTQTSRFDFSGYEQSWAEKSLWDFSGKTPKMEDLRKVKKKRKMPGKDKSKQSSPCFGEEAGEVLKNFDKILSERKNGVEVGTNIDDSNCDEDDERKTLENVEITRTKFVFNNASKYAEIEWAKSEDLPDNNQKNLEDKKQEIVDNNERKFEDQKEKIVDNNDRKFKDKKKEIVDNNERKLEDKKEEIVDNEERKFGDNEEEIVDNDRKPKDKREEIIVNNERKLEDKKEEIVDNKERKLEDRKKEIVDNKERKFGDKEGIIVDNSERKLEDKKEEIVDNKERKFGDKEEKIVDNSERKPKDKKEEIVVNNERKFEDKKEKVVDNKERKLKDKKEEVVDNKERKLEDKKEGIVDKEERKFEDKKQDIIDDYERKIEDKEQEILDNNERRLSNKKEEIVPTFEESKNKYSSPKPNEIQEENLLVTNEIRSIIENIISDIPLVNPLRNVCNSEICTSNSALNSCKALQEIGCVALVEYKYFFREFKWPVVKLPVEESAVKVAAKTSGEIARKESKSKQKRLVKFEEIKCVIS